MASSGYSATIFRLLYGKECSADWRILHRCMRAISALDDKHTYMACSSDKWQSESTRLVPCSHITLLLGCRSKVRSFQFCDISVVSPSPGNKTKLVHTLTLLLLLGLFLLALILDSRAGIVEKIGSFGIIKFGYFGCSLLGLFTFCRF